MLGIADAPETTKKAGAKDKAEEESMDVDIS